MNIHSNVEQELPMSSKSRIASSLLLALSLGLVACQDTDGRENGELGQRLAEPTTLAISTSSTAAIAGHDSAGTEVSVGPLTVEGGDITVRRNDDGDLEISRFEVRLGDIVADDGSLSAHPATLTNVKVSLGRAIILHDAWSLTGETARGGVNGDIRLDWSLVGDDGSVVPLATQKFARAAIRIALAAEADGSVSARLETTIDGSLLASWGIELSDFAMTLSASGGQ
jgi:hypothetical protein